VHSTNNSKEEFERFMRDMHGSGKLPRGKSVGIPYSILVPKGFENLWIAGAAIPATPRCTARSARSRRRS